MVFLASTSASAIYFTYWADGTGNPSVLQDGRLQVAQIPLFDDCHFSSTSVECSSSIPLQGLNM